VGHHPHRGQGEALSAQPVPQVPSKLAGTRAQGDCPLQERRSLIAGDSDAPAGGFKDVKSMAGGILLWNKDVNLATAVLRRIEGGEWTREA